MPGSVWRARREPAGRVGWPSEHQSMADGCLSCLLLCAHIGSMMSCSGGRSHSHASFHQRRARSSTSLRALNLPFSLFCDISETRCIKCVICGDMSGRPSAKLARGLERRCYQKYRCRRLRRRYVSGLCSFIDSNEVSCEHGLRILGSDTVSTIPYHPNRMRSRS